MSSFYSLTKSLKDCLFTTVLYGWLIPTVWVTDHLNEWLPSRQLTSTDWVIEALSNSILAFPLSTTDTKECVVPKSIPIFAMITPYDPYNCCHVIK